MLIDLYFLLIIRCENTRKPQSVGFWKGKADHSAHVSLSLIFFCDNDEYRIPQGLSQWQSVERVSRPSPDVSLPVDWLTHWLKCNGVCVVPNVRWSTEYTYQFCFDGLKQGDIIQFIDADPEKGYFYRSQTINEFLIDQHILNLSVLRIWLPGISAVPKKGHYQLFLWKERFVNMLLGNSALHSFLTLSCVRT